MVDDAAAGGIPPPRGMPADAPIDASYVDVMPPQVGGPQSAGALPPPSGPQAIDAGQLDQMAARLARAQAGVNGMAPNPQEDIIMRALQDSGPGAHTLSNLARARPRMK